jgi:DNA repair exonuclease SbcCD nuclease subunit
MKKSKVAIFSDLHLGIYGNSEEWHGVALKWADWMVEELKKKNIKDILFLGDFFHNRSEISVQTIHVASLILDKLKDFSIIMIVGNHDAYYKNRADTHSLALLRGHENLTIVDSNYEVEQFDKRMLFVPWNAELPDSSYDYIFGHFEILNFKMNNHKVCEHGLDSMNLLEKSSMIFSGHFHTRSHKKYKQGDIIYVGNTFPQDFNDYGDVKGYYILDLEDGALEFYENEVSPRFVKIFASKLIQKEYTSDDFKNNVIDLIIDTELTDKQVEKIQTLIAKHKPFRFSTVYNTTSITINDVKEIDSLNLEEEIDSYVDNIKLEDEQPKRVKEILKKLYEGNNL